MNKSNTSIGYLYLMKVTATLPDDIIADVKEFAKGKNLTERLINALNDWRYQKRFQQLKAQLRDQPVGFEEGFTAKKVREMNNRDDRYRLLRKPGEAE